MSIDLHSHSKHSDGALTPNALLERAAQKGVSLFSITDHDTTAAYANHINLNGVTLIPGIELSTSWHNTNIHILGLKINPDSDAMLDACAVQSAARHERAQNISDILHKKGILGALDGARAIADGAQIGRPHFAQHLVNTGVCSNLNQSYKRYLGAGKACDVKNLWASMQQVIDWIRDAGGIAVMAHPAKYKLTRTKLARLIETFKASGGEAMEIYSGNQKAETTKMLSTVAEHFKLLSSCGSDFHSPEAHWNELGNIPPLPANCRPIWERWQ